MKSNKEYGKRLRLSPEEVDYILQKRATNLDNINNNTALDVHCEERGIDKKDIVRNPLISRILDKYEEN